LKNLNMIYLLAVLLLVPSWSAAASYAYVANAGSDSVSVINTASNTVTATVPVGSYPLGVAVNPAGTFVYVANYYSNSVSVINTASNTVTATVPVGTAPVGVAVNPAGTFVYVANISSNSVSVIDTASNTVTATVPVGSGPYSLGRFIGPDLSPVVTVPTLSEWAMISFAMLIVGFGVVQQRRRQFNSLNR
jgi:YVTN family beta-propeller protein